MFGCCTKSCEELPVVLKNVRFAQTSYELSNVVRGRTGFFCWSEGVLWQRDFSVGVTAFSVRVAGFLVGVGGFCVGFNCVFVGANGFCDGTAARMLG